MSIRDEISHHTRILFDYYGFIGFILKDALIENNTCLRIQSNECDLPAPLVEMGYAMRPLHTIQGVAKVL